MTEFKTDISENGKKFELVFQTDNKAYFEKMQATARECIDHKPVTQFDRIKTKIANMSIDELSYFLVLMKTCDKYCAYTKDSLCNKYENDGQGSCVDGVKQWLDQEVSE